MIKLLIVDDSALMRKVLGRVFAAEGDFVIEFAKDGAEALIKVKQFSPDVVTLDITMPQMDGLTCLDRIMVEHPCPVVMVSALTERGAEETLAALDAGAVDFVPKPGGAISLDIDEVAPLLVEKVRAAARIRVRRTQRLAERVRLRTLGASPASPSAKRAERPAASGDGLVIVGVSTGGPPALEALLAPLPANFPWPIVIAQHMPASFTGPLARRLDALCAIAVSEVTGPTLLVGGAAYIAKGDADITIGRRNGALVAMAAPASAAFRWHPSAERLMRSALDHLPPGQLVGVLMTGMGNDGAAAMAELAARGGNTIAEAQDSAVVWGMPGELVRLGGARHVVSLPGIAARLIELVPKP